MKRISTYIFLLTSVLAIGVIIGSWGFLSKEIGAAQLTEKTIAGDRNAADGLVVAFRADSADSLHWLNGYDYTENSTVSSFSRGDMPQTKEVSVYRDFRFTGWSTESFYTQLKYDALNGLQDKSIQGFYSDMQKQAAGDKSEKEGEILLKNHLDYYPVNFRFQFGEKVYNSATMLQGLKKYADKDELTEENAKPYEGDIELYKVLNDRFRIPVIENEYQQYKVSSSGKTEVHKSLDDGKDYYEFDPVIVLQQENIRDGKNWVHPDTIKEAGTKDNDSAIEMASSYGLKNRMLFVVNNTTAKRNPVDLSQIKDGFGIYELPIDSAATITIGKGRKNLFIPDPKPLSDQLNMVYPLDENAEYVEMSLSGDHRQLAVFYIKKDSYYIEIVDADTWESKLREKIFPASEKMSYSWGDDGTLAVTDYNGHIALLTKNENSAKPYEIFYKGSVSDNVDQELFAAEMVTKKHSYGRYAYGVDKGLAIVAEKDRIALVNNSPIGNSGLKNPDLICAVIDRTGLVYKGILQSNLVDIDYGITNAELKEILQMDEGSAVQDIIKPVSNENKAAWKTQ